MERKPRVIRHRPNGPIDPDERAAVWLALGDQIDGHCPPGWRLGGVFVCALYLSPPTGEQCQGYYEMLSRKAPDLEMTDAHWYHDIARETRRRADHYEEEHEGRMCDPGEHESDA